MGAGPGTIVRAFFMAAAGVGLVGTTAGAALGLLIAVSMKPIARFVSALGGGGPGAGWSELEFITSAPVRIDPIEIGLVVVIALVLSLIAAAYPAWRSTRVEPVEALRNE
jgi:lipoprotein-releasing system permease protein